MGRMFTVARRSQLFWLAGLCTPGLWAGAQGAPPAARAEIGSGGALRIEAHHAIVAIPPGWSRLSPDLLISINDATRRSGGGAVAYLDGLVPDTQPPEGLVYALLQWEETPTVGSTPAQIERTIRANLVAASGGGDPGTQIRVSEPVFDWPASRISFRSEQLAAGKQTVTDSTGVLSATGILWIHGYPPARGEAGMATDTHLASLEADLRLIASSARFDSGYAYVPPPPDASGLENPGGGSAGAKSSGTKVAWLVPLVIGLGAVLSWVLSRPRKA
jgi:hypothetical protein